MAKINQNYLENFEDSPRPDSQSQPLPQTLACTASVTLLTSLQSRTLPRSARLINPRCFINFKQM